MAVVIVAASSKGGCAKSTTILSLAGAYADMGNKVCIIDADRAARMADWATGGNRADQIVVRTADERTLNETIRAARPDFDVILVDVEGTANAAIMAAVGFANFVVIPANPSAPDVASAFETVKLIRTVADMRERPVHHALLWVRVPQFWAREFDAQQRDVVEAGVPILGRIHERIAYKSMFAYQKVLADLDTKEVPGVAKATAEAAQLANNIFDQIEQAAQTKESA